MSSHQSAARRRRAVLTLAACAASLPLATKALAASPFTWTQTTAGTYSWSTAANWDANGAPTTGNTTVVNFYAASNATGPAGGTTIEADNDITSPFDLNQLNLNGTTTTAGTGFVFNIGGSGIEFDGTNAQLNLNATYGASNDAGTTYNINSDLTFNTATTLTFADNGANLNLNGNFFGAGTLTIAENEPDRYVNVDVGDVAASTSTFTGNINVTVGTLRVGGVHNIFGTNGVTDFTSGAGLGTQTITVSNNASVVLDNGGGAFQYGQNFVISGNGTNAPAVNGNGTGTGQQLGVDAALDVNNYNFNQVFIGGLAVAANATIRTDINDSGTIAGTPGASANYGLQVDGPVSGTGNLTKIGSGYVWLNAASAAFTGTGGYGAYTGNVIVNGGAIVNENVVGALGLNQMTYVAGTGYSYPTVSNANTYTTANGTIIGNQTITVNPGGSFVLFDWNYGPGSTTQNFVISGTGNTTRNYLTNPTTTGIIDAAGTDAALQLLTVNTGNHIVYGGLALAGNATIRVNATGLFAGGSAGNSDDPENYQVLNAGIPGLQFNGPLAGSGTLTKIGSSELGSSSGTGAAFDQYQLPYAYTGGTGYPEDVTDGVLEFNATAGPVAGYAAFTGNVNISGGVLATGQADDALGFNTSHTQNVTVSSSSTDNFGDADNHGSSMLLDEGNGAYKNPQNFILNGTGTSDPLPLNEATMTGLKVAGSDAALEVYRLNYGNTTIGALDIHTSSTVRVNTDMGGSQLAIPANSAGNATNTQAATVSATYASTLSAPNLALEVDGPLLGTGTLTLVGKTGDTILKDLWVSNGGYGTLLLTQTSATIAGISDPVFSGNVNVNGGVLELQGASNELGTGSQTVTVASGAAVVFNGYTLNTVTPGFYAEPQNFTINGTGTGDVAANYTPAVTPLGGAAALEATGIAGGNFSIGAVTLATASTIKVTSTAPYGLQMNGALGGTGALTLTGAGSLILKAASTYAQGISVVGGATLVASNTSGSATGTGNVTLGNLTLGSGTMASGTVGTITGNVLAGTGPNTVAPGGRGTIGTLTIGSITTSGTAANLTTLSFDPSNSTSVLAGGNTIYTGGDLLLLTGSTATFATGTAMSFTTPTVSGDYRLIGDPNHTAVITAITAPNTTFAVPAAPVGDTYLLSTTVDSGYVDLVATIGPSGPANLVWSGGTSAWDVATSANWNSNASVFHQGDIVTFDNTNTGSVSIAINASPSTTVNPTSVAVNGSKSYSFTGNGIGDYTSGPTTLTQTGTGTLTLSNVNTYTGATTIGTGSDSPILTLAAAGKIASTSLVVNAGATANINGLLSGTTPAVTANGTVALGASNASNDPTSVILNRTLGALSVGAAGNVTIAPATTHATRNVLVVSSLTNNGLINLSNNDMIIHNGNTGSVSTAGSIANQLKLGFNAGSGYWNGTTGIVSSSAASDATHLTTLGYRTGGTGATPFDGVTTTSTDVLVKYTYYGDADLNGTINGADYQQIDAGFGAHGTNNMTGWQYGDFNYDGVVDGSDFSLIDNTFNQITATGASPLAIIGGSANLTASPADTISAANVPEPTTLGLLGIGAIGLLGRRRRRNG